MAVVNNLFEILFSVLSDTYLEAELLDHRVVYFKKSLRGTVFKVAAPSVCYIYF